MNYRNYDGKLTGKYIGEIVNGDKEAEYLKAIAGRKAFTSIKRLL
jgi:hypothetical protein